MSEAEERLVALRRELHRRPEPAWREFWTTCRIVEELERIGVDDLAVGPEALAGDERLGVPDDDALRAAYERARDAGVDGEILAKLEGGHTGAVATIHEGDGPTIALRVDLDGLPRAESEDPDHLPAREGFRSIHEGAMHACGHDGHTAVGLAVLDRLRGSAFGGTLKVLFQPAEEVVGGGRALARSGHLDGVDYLLALHFGLDHPTGEVVAGVDGFLAVSQFEATFAGEAAHAGARPNEGRNAVQALAVAIQNLYGIARHRDGATRVNVGRVEGGSAVNIVPEHARCEVEVRGETTELMEYMDEHARRTIRSAAAMHDCEATIETVAEAPSAESDPELAGVVGAVAREHAAVDSVLDSDNLGGSEDATYLMRAVQEGGGLATYVIVGTDHPGGHHTATFDLDEASLPVAVDVLTESVVRIAADRP